MYTLKKERENSRDSTTKERKLKNKYRKSRKKNSREK